MMSRVLWLAGLCRPRVGQLRGVCAAAALALAAVALPMQVAHAQPVQAESTGKVVRVNPAAGKITLSHGAISKLDLPAMTLVYHADPALLTGIAVGDQVTFTAQRADNQYQVVALKKK